MSSKIVSAQDIAEIADLINDKTAIEILKDIRDNIITEEDCKGKKENNEVFQFVGYARYDDIIEGDPDKDEDAANSDATLRKLIKKGMILEGFYIGLLKKNTKKYGDARLADSDNKIGKYKLTDEGAALLAAVEEGDNKRSANKNTSAAPKTKTKKRSLSRKDEEDELDEEEEEQNKETAVKAAKGIKEFKQEQDKELGKK